MVKPMKNMRRQFMQRDFRRDLMKVEEENELNSMISKSYSLKKFPIQLYGRKGMKGLKISS
jgi:hypothetical protein